VHIVPLGQTIPYVQQDIIQIAQVRRPHLHALIAQLDSFVHRLAPIQLLNLQHPVQKANIARLNLHQEPIAWLGRIVTKTI